MKTCSKCKIERSYLAFSPDKKMKSGLSSICKVCRNQWVQNKREQIRGFSVIPPLVQKQYSKSNPYIKCKKCEQLLHEVNFHKQSSSKTGRSNLCKPCTKERDKHGYIKRAEEIKQKSKDHYYRNKHLYKARAKRFSLKKFFGLTVCEYEQMIKSCDNSCEICGRDRSRLNKNLSVDHNHVTGKVRGMLCSSCNHAIGMLNCDVGIDRLQNAIDYIKRTETLNFI